MGGHYRAAAKILEGEGKISARLWVCPPTRMDEEILKKEGYYEIFEKAGSRMEMPGCSLCMGNQARVEDNSTVFSTSTKFQQQIRKRSSSVLRKCRIGCCLRFVRSYPYN